MAMKMSRYSLLLGLGIVVVFGTVIALHWPRDGRPVPTEPAPSPATAARLPESRILDVSASDPESAPASEQAAPASPAVVPRVVGADEARFRAATDYLEFARDMLARARAGDRDAQYHLYAAMDYCRRGYRDYFDRGQQRRSLDEALRLEGTSPSVSREVREVHSRCHNLMSLQTSELGEGEQWLQRAARAGHPRAQLQLASRLISGSRMLAPQQATRSVAEARQFIRQSLASRDPEVIWSAATLPDLAGDAGARDRTETMAWWQAACDQGLDCGPGSDHVKQLCREVPDCQPFESVNDILLRSAPDPAAVTERAKQINASLAAGDFRDLGLEGLASNQ
jgi:hypothetical protein